MDAHQSIMNNNDRTTLSRTLSKILRHKAHDEGLSIRSDGYISISALLARPKLSNLKTNLEKIKQVVEKDNKSRFTLTQEDDGEWFIRANQGHSLSVDKLSLTPITDASAYPTVLHGTSLAAWQSIKSQGLSRMKRNHIHCATGKFGTVTSGVRKNCEVFIYLDLSTAIHDGIPFYESSNGVVLTSGLEGTISPRYFSRVEAADGTVLLDQHTDRLTHGVDRLSLGTGLDVRALFGCTAETVLPKSWLDASLLRQVPDTQEVFLDPDDAERSFIVELVERLDVPDHKAGAQHYCVLSEDNDATECRITAEETLSFDDDEHKGQSTTILVAGVQKVAKFSNSSAQTEVSVVMGIVRLAQVSTDVLLMCNAPLSPTSEQENVAIVKAALANFKIKDWSLFPECA